MVPTISLSGPIKQTSIPTCWDVERALCWRIDQAKQSDMRTAKAFESNRFFNQRVLSIQKAL